MHVDSVPISFVIFPLTLINVTISMPELSFTVSLVLEPFPLIFPPILVYHNTLSVPDKLPIFLLNLPYVYCILVLFNLDKCRVSILFKRIQPFHKINLITLHCILTIKEVSQVFYSVQSFLIFNLTLAWIRNWRQ